MARVTLGWLAGLAFSGCASFGGTAAQGIGARVQSSEARNGVEKGPDCEGALGFRTESRAGQFALASNLASQPQGGLVGREHQAKPL